LKKAANHSHDGILSKVRHGHPIAGLNLRIVFIHGIENGCMGAYTMCVAAFSVYRKDGL